MGTLDPDKYQELLAKPDELDSVPVRLIRHQAQKCAAIISAGRMGHAAYAEEIRNAAGFLQGAALEAGAILSASRTAEAFWQELNDRPWPLSGPPKD
ncbi:hypothetical protein [Paeniglutamicibacter sp.]|uniref:hypothetical protein n=1 Tax=Paeniglutamicibacter sp. TaxID=1934391 RepID=UPI00398A20E8